MSYKSHNIKVLRSLQFWRMASSYYCRVHPFRCAAACRAASYYCPPRGLIVPSERSFSRGVSRKESLARSLSREESLTGVSCKEFSQGVSLARSLSRKERGVSRESLSRGVSCELAKSLCEESLARSLSRGVSHDESLARSLSSQGVSCGKESLVVRSCEESLCEESLARSSREGREESLATREESLARSLSREESLARSLSRGVSRCEESLSRE